MIFSLRRKRPTTPRAWRAKRAMTIISLVAAAWSVCAWSVQAQSFQPALTPNTETVVTPKFVPVGQRPTGVVAAGYAQPLLPAQQPNRDVPAAQQRRPAPAEDIADLNLRVDLPGQQRLFMRESEAQFYERIRQDAKRQPGSNPAIFPIEEPVSNQSYVQPSYPRLDPRTKQPFADRAMTVEPCYVMHRRLLFEQPNFERAGYDLGVAQPLVSLGVFYYDMATAPYHIWSDLRDRNESSAGKCLPGDPAPFTVPCEKFSVTGLVGQAGVMVGLGFMFP
jgi:hypothetical protein